MDAKIENSARLSGPARPPRRVLVVEDELAIRELTALELAGFVLEEAGDGRRGLEAARARRTT
jgi:CheY-like chemotaxis protein